MSAATNASIAGDRASPKVTFFANHGAIAYNRTLEIAICANRDTIANDCPSGDFSAIAN
jgi:hypothetical protein